MQKLVIASVSLLVLGSLPVWSCGLRKRLTFWEFVIAHTAWGPEPEYVPEELYTQPLTEDELHKVCAISEAGQITGPRTTSPSQP